MDETPEPAETEAPEAEVADATAVEHTDTAPPAADPGAGFGRMLLAVLVALLIATVTVTLWGVLLQKFNKDFVGLTVVGGLVLGYAMREISRRSNILVRLVSVVITALACVAGTVVSEAAFFSRKYHVAFGTIFDERKKEWWFLLRHRTTMQFVIYAVALLIAFLAAGPAKPKKVTTDDEPAEPAADEPVADAEPSEG